MAKKQLEDDLLTGGSLNADDKSAKKAAKAKKSAEKKAAIFMNLLMTQIIQAFVFYNC